MCYRLCDLLGHAACTSSLVFCISQKVLAAAGAARPDHEANKRIYGKDSIQPADILNGKTPPPSAFAFPGFSALIDDLHALEALRKKEIPPELLLRRPSRQDPSSRGPRQGFTGGPRGFHRFGSGSNRQQQPPVK